ncbi:MAG: o-succinylbenzoate synthase [Gammaproteobacteria bacterium]|nr:o-succinylbenzoate synthase [Gammaproteobacteria bacterium]
MRIRAASLFGFALPLARLLPAPQAPAANREGLLLRLADEVGHEALGEATPLAGFSPDTLATTRRDLEHFCHTAVEHRIPEGLEALDGGFEAWLGTSGYGPAARCAVEAAILGLVAARRGLGLARLLNPAAPTEVAVNGLVSGAPDDAAAGARRLVAAGHHTLKLKVGGLEPDPEIARITTVREAMGPGTRLRLDANRAWPVAVARGLLEDLVRQPVGAGATIEYVEEPASDLEGFRALGALGLAPLALDEGLREMAPEALAAVAGLGAVVLKPTLLGLEHAAAFAREARRLRLGVVVGSTFESGVGVGILAHLAAAWAEAGCAAGLGTLGWFGRDLPASPVETSPGFMPVDPAQAAPPELDTTLLSPLHGSPTPS